jgi:hypothetical protein
MNNPIQIFECASELAAKHAHKKNDTAIDQVLWHKTGQLTAVENSFEDDSHSKARSASLNTALGILELSALECTRESCAPALDQLLAIVQAETESSNLRVRTACVYTAGTPDDSALLFAPLVEGLRSRYVTELRLADPIANIQSLLFTPYCILAHAQIHLRCNIVRTGL